MPIPTTESPASPPAEQGRYSAGTILTIAVLLAAGIVFDGYRRQFDVAAWQLWGAVGAIVLLCLVGGYKRNGKIENPEAKAPWRLLLATKNYEDALRMMVAHVKETGDSDLGTYVQIADLYAHPDIALYEDAVLWLSAVLDRIDDSPETADILLRRGNLYNDYLGDARRAAVDWAVCEKQFPDSAAAVLAGQRRARLRSTWRARKPQTRTSAPTPRTP
jgi:hypothetical protein